MQLATAHGLGREYDYLQRLIKRSLPSLTENYTYAAGEEANTTTTLVSGKTNTLNGTVISNFEYLYDENGNITRILDRATGTGVIYTYDELNQLIGTSNSSLRMESYTYDAHGNLLTFNNGLTTHTYSYGDSEWKDKLSAVDGVPFLYDALGNPLYYYNGSNYSLSWTEGRKLATITTGGKTTDYLYDASGNRIKKINDGDSYIIYVNVDGIPLGEKHYNAEDELVKTLRYIYDEYGSVCGYIANSADGAGTYHFIKNLQGDVTHVYRLGDNAIVASYSYDSWGNIISATGEKAQENPFRYRGYYYDVETGFYATGSRYYDPKIGRFINTDVFPSTGQGVIGNNMYAYCGNNPISRRDANGYAWETIWDIVSLGTSVAEVVANPADPWAWAGLVGDVVDVVVPFAGGVGEVIKASKYINSVVEIADTVHDVTNAVEVADNTVDTAKIGWRLGDDITNLTKSGKKPSWTTVRQRFWKNEALYNPSSYIDEMLDLMKKGRAPIVDGYPMELHHPNGRVGQYYWDFYPLTHQAHHMEHYGW